MTDKITRRTVLLRGLQIPVGGALLVALNGCGGGSESSSSTAGGASACADPNTLSDAERSMRSSTNYTDTSPDPQKVCAGCAFFTSAEAQGSCAPCQILQGPVNSAGHCNSWSAKA